MRPYYQDDLVTLYHGDCRDVLPSLVGIDLVVTSPPYNQLESLPENGSGFWGQSTGGAGFLREWASSGYSDEVPESEYQAQQNGLFGAIRANCNPTASLFYNHQIRWRDGECIHPIHWFRPIGWSLRQEIIWDRCGGMMFNARMFCRFDERILWFVADGWKWNQASVGHGTVWRIARQQQQQGKWHPVAYPLDVPMRCIAAASDAGDLVFDPFAGGGTTLAAAKELGRRGVGVEIEERYCEQIAKRLSQTVLDFGGAA